MNEPDSTEDVRRPATDPPPRADDTRLGRYRLAFEMASGGMASLYLAVAESTGGFGKVLALKRIHPHLAKERDFREMFLDEARVASLLQHPNVCGVLDYGEEDGLPYFTMEYLLGESLSRVQRAEVKADDPSPERSRFAARIVADAAHGLHAAHELRDPEGRLVELVHRDVSPQNLIVGYDGVTRVLDFGIARTRVQEHHTSTGTIKGKFAYMAPEQLLGEDIDRRADVWALGILLWETLVGARLFKRKTEMETLLAVTQGPIADPRVLYPDLDPELAAVVTRALKRDRNERYDTAEDMARDLERYLVKDQEPYGTRDVAAHMAELFPSGLAKKRAVIADALARRTSAAAKRAHTPTTASLDGFEDISVVVTGPEPTPRAPKAAWAGMAVALALASSIAVYFAVRPSEGAERDSGADSATREVGEVPRIDGASPPEAPAARAPTEELAAPPEEEVEAELAAPADDRVPADVRRPRRPFAPRANVQPAVEEAAPPVRAEAEPRPVAQPEPRAEERRRPFIVESLELGGGGAPSGEDEGPRRPLIVDELSPTP